MERGGVRGDRIGKGRLPSSFRFFGRKARCVLETMIRVLMQLDHANPSDGMSFSPVPETATIF